MHMHALQCLIHMLTRAVVAVLAQDLASPPLIGFICILGVPSGVAGCRARAAGDDKPGQLAFNDASRAPLLAGVGALRRPLCAAPGESGSHFWLA